MAPKCYVSYKSIDLGYRETIDKMGVDTAANIFDGTANYDDEIIIRRLRSGSFADTTVTIHLIGMLSAEYLGWEKQKYIKRELQASALPAADGLPNAILGIVLPWAYTRVYSGNHAKISDKTVISEFARAYRSGCMLIRWDFFINRPHTLITAAHAARTAAGGEKETYGWQPFHEQA